MEDLSQWISLDNLLIHEDKVFMGVVSWIEHDKENRKDYFEPLMERVRTQFLSRDCLEKLKEIGNHKVTEGEKLARSGHDEMLIARIETKDVKGRNQTYLFTFNFMVNLLLIILRCDSICRIAQHVTEWSLVKS